MSNSTWWSIQINRTELQDDPDRENGLKLPVVIHLDVPLDRCPASDTAKNPIEIEEVRLWNRSEKAYTDEHLFEKDDSAWNKDEEGAWREYRCMLSIPDKNCFKWPIQSLEDALSIEIYDTTSGVTPWFYKLPQLTRADVDRIVIKVNH